MIREMNDIDIGGLRRLSLGESHLASSLYGSSIHYNLVWVHRALALLLLAVAGCGVRDRAAPWRAIFVDKEHVCFSMDKKDVLSRYNISSTQDGIYKEFAVKEHVSFSYPDSCINLTLTPGYTYGVSYTLNNKNYRYVFFVDNQWHVKRTL